MARLYNVSRQTIRKWKTREAPLDKTSRPDRFKTTLSPEQEAIVINLRTTLLLPVDDLLAVTREFINEKRSGLLRLLTRMGVSNLKALRAELTSESEHKEKPKAFKDYPPGYLHVDIKYLPKMPDETQRSYLFIAIDRATRWVFAEIYPDQTEASNIHFVQQLYAKAPMKITKILTDNGTQFTDRFTSKGKEPSGQHAFDILCKNPNIEHRLITPRHPQTNGMVERFNGRIAEIVKQTRFISAKDLKSTLYRYIRVYNGCIPQRNLGHLTPMQTLQNYQISHPECFRFSVPNEANLDRQTSLRD